jgi:hypothetical protein
VATDNSNAPSGPTEERLAPLFAAAPPRSTGRIRSLAEARSALLIPTSAAPDVLQAWGRPADCQFNAFLVSDPDDPQLVAEFAALRLLKREGRRLVSAEPGDRLQLDQASNVLWVVYGGVVQAADGMLVIESLSIGPAFAAQQHRQSGDASHSITSQLLRLLSPTRLLNQTVEQLQTEGHWLDTITREGGPHVAETQRDLLDRIDHGRPKKTRITDDQLTEIAQRYIVLCLRGLKHPLPQIAREFGISRAQARDRVHKARTQRYLEPGTQGRAGATIGPRLKQLGCHRRDKLVHVVTRTRRAHRRLAVSVLALAVGTLAAVSHASGSDTVSPTEQPFKTPAAALQLTRKSDSTVPFMQQGPKLTPRAGGVNGEFGFSVAVSGDGRTALVGANYDNGGRGAAWVFTRSGSTWRQQGTKLTGGDEVGPGDFGGSVALSAGGDTAVVGGANDDHHTGAVWIFRRSGSTWKQQGTKLTGNGEVGRGGFGISVALSRAGRTALVGADADDDQAGAAWVFTRSGSAWKAQGEKLTPSDETGVRLGGHQFGGRFGSSVALSADGGTALIGGQADSGSRGAAWIFVRSGSGWRQQGKKLTGRGETVVGNFGSAVALSAAGDTALVGAMNDTGPSSGKSLVGAAWLFSRSGSAWTRQDEKLTGAGEAGRGAFGLSAALSADGRTALVGAPRNAARGYATWGTGAVWAFTRSSAGWKAVGKKLTGAGESGAGAFGFSVALSADAGTALIAAPYDGHPSMGAVWTFHR